MSKEISNKKYIRLLIIIIMSFIVLYVGRFLFLSLVSDAGNNSEDIAEKKPFPIEYGRIETVYKGNKQVINILEVDPADKRILLKPILSHDSVFGFELLSEMSMRHKAYAAVNAGFFYEYGDPSGMVAINGRLLRKSTGLFPVLTISGGRAALSTMETRIKVRYNNHSIVIDDINAMGKTGQTVLYTREFGTDNRAKNNNYSVLIRDNIVVEAGYHPSQVTIPKGHTLLTFYAPDEALVEKLLFEKDGKINIIFDPVIAPDFQAYECGSWLIKNGEIVVPERDDWVGVLTNYDPRTAVAIDDVGKVIFITVDGRQPGYSIGMTGRDLAEFLLEYGIKDAAMLDGGASTVMIYKGEIVNRPSYKGQERMLGGGLAVFVE